MARAGFNAFEVKKAADAEAFTQALSAYSIRYQPAGSDSPTFRAGLRGAFRFST